MPSLLQPLIEPTPASIIQPIEPITPNRPIPSYQEPLVRPPPRPPDATPVSDNWKDFSDFDTDRKIKFEEISPHQEGIISKTYERPDKSYIQEPTELKGLIDTTNLIKIFLPKQTDIDKILDGIKRKVSERHTPATNHLRNPNWNLTSPYFKDLCLYLAQKKLPSKKSAMHKVENLAEQFILLDYLLFKIVATPEKETVLLAMPEICTDKIITLYHTGLFVGHQGVIKTYLTISNKWFIPGLMHYLRSFIKKGVIHVNW